MKQFIGLAALAALTVASPHPRPQFLDLADVIPPSEVAPPVKIPMGLGAVSDVLPVGDVISKRDGDCSPQPAGSGPKPAQDTPSAFTSDTDFSTAANGATTPTGYKLAFQNLKASSQTSVGSMQCKIFTITNDAMCRLIWVIMPLAVTIPRPVLLSARLLLDVWHSTYFSSVIPPRTPVPTAQTLHQLQSSSAYCGVQKSRHKPRPILVSIVASSRW